MICKYYDCTGLTSIQIPNSATYIGEDALYGCTGLTSIQIPSPITKIGNSVFEGCENIVSINVDNDNPEYSSEDNVMFNKDKTELIYCARGKEGVYEIPNSVTKIGLRAFSRCTRLTNIKIPHSIKSLEKFAFEGCSSLTSIEMPNSIKNLEEYAFYNCSNLKKVYFSQHIEENIFKALIEDANLSEVHIKAEDPNTQGVKFDEEDVKNITLYVPIGTGYAYRHHPEFRKFKEVKIE